MLNLSFLFYDFGIKKNKFLFLGYGKFSPTSDIGKIFTIIVAFIGVPVNIVILAKIGELLKKMFVSLLKPLSRYIRNKRIYMILQVLTIII